MALALVVTVMSSQSEWTMPRPRPVERSGGAMAHVSGWSTGLFAVTVLAPTMESSHDVVVEVTPSLVGALVVSTAEARGCYERGTAD